MPDQHLFISYARADALDIAVKLAADLRAAGFTTWRDQENLDSSRPFDPQIKTAIREARVLLACVSPDVERDDSFVCNEIAYARAKEIPIIPLLLPGGELPLEIYRLTYVKFSDYEGGLRSLLDLLKKPGQPQPPPQVTGRERELVFLQSVGERFKELLYRYTDLAGMAEKERPAQPPKVAVKPWVRQYTNTLNAVYEERGYVEQGTVREVETVNQLREVVRAGGVVLIGEPGSGKTTTLQRLAYEFALEAVEDPAKPLPLFVPLGGYTGGGLSAYIARYFRPDLNSSVDSLTLDDYLPGRLILLLDGLNEMPAQYTNEVDAWIRANPALRLVVTCRRLDYAALKALPLRRVDVAPLDPPRIRQFIGNFVEDADRERLFWALAGQPMTEVWAAWQKEDVPFEMFWTGEDVKEGHPAYGQIGWKHMRAYNTMRAAMRASGHLPGLLGLVSNPFLLNITVELFMNDGQPPANRGQLFHDFADRLIAKRGALAVSAAHPAVPPDTQKRALAALAYRMQAENLGTAVALEWARAALQEANPVLDADNLLYLAESATLLTVSAGQVKFFHQLLQEYFAAFHLGQLITAAGLKASTLWPPASWWPPNGWEETVVLLAGMQPGIAAWLLEVHPVLACRALTEGLSLPADSPLTRQVQSALVTAMTGDAPPTARAEAGRIINRLGDPRPGVGLRPDGLPDIVWCDVPAGEFIFGQSKNQQRLTLPAYQIAKYPVTYAQFQAFIDDPEGFHDPRWWVGLAQRDESPGDQAFKYDNHPRERVTWYSALAFCNWLTYKLNPAAWQWLQDWRAENPGQSYPNLSHAPQSSVPSSQSFAFIRLPAEAEWEKAARGTDGRIYPYGNDFDANKGSSRDTGIGMTSAVGIFLEGASPCGALEMSGNVWERCLSKYVEDYQWPEDNAVNGTNDRCLRGGSWDGLQDLARAVSRYDFPASDRNSDIGFRLVCVSPSE